MSTWNGPTFRRVEERPAEAGPGKGGVLPTGPLLVRGAVKSWPAWSRWTFPALAQLRRPDGGEVLCRFQEGLVEQGATRPLPVLPVAPYLEKLQQDSLVPLSPESGLCPASRLKSLAPGDSFTLDWSFMGSIQKGQRYLADWPILHEFPALRRDFAIRELWPGLRFTWEYVFIGPAHTVTGLHQDIHDNWFCQVKGTKELLLFPSDQSPHMCVSGKYNLGSVLSEIDILKLGEQPERASQFERTRGFYARVEAGDALYLPKNTWHAVIALEPSISLGIFGLTAWEAATAGAWAELKNWFHLARLYRYRNCICHESAVPS